MKPIKLFMCGLCLLGLGVGAASAQPEPSPVRVAWELSFEPTPPMRISVDAGKGAQTYWYMLYTVSNNTGDDVDFHPEIDRVNEIESDLPAEFVGVQAQSAPRITVDPAMVGLHPKVFQAIKDQHARTHPFLVSPIEAIGKLLQGKDNARSSVAVFRALGPRVSRFTFYIGGLSGERITKRNPLYDASRPGTAGTKASGKVSVSDGGIPKFFVLRKTLAIPYTLPGDAGTRRSAKPVLGKMTWVMR